MARFTCGQLKPRVRAGNFSQLFDAVALEPPGEGRKAHLELRERGDAYGQLVFRRQPPRLVHIPRQVGLDAEVAAEVHSLPLREVVGDEGHERLHLRLHVARTREQVAAGRRPRDEVVERHRLLVGDARHFERLLRPRVDGSNDVVLKDASGIEFINFFAHNGSLSVFNGWMKGFPRHDSPRFSA